MLNTKCLRKFSTRLSTFSLLISICTWNLCLAQTAELETSFDTKTVVSTLSGVKSNLAPGALITINGIDLSATSQTCASLITDKISPELCSPPSCVPGLKLQEVLCGTRVTTESLLGKNKFFPLFSVSEGEIQLQVPNEIAIGEDRLCVIHNFTQTNSNSNDDLVNIDDIEGATCEDIVVKAQAPVVSNTRGFVTAFHKDLTEVSSKAPALVGETILIRASGLGKSNPASKDGEISTSQPSVKKPLADLISPDGRSKTKLKVLKSYKLAGSIGLDTFEVKIPKLPKLQKNKATNFLLQFDTRDKKTNKSYKPKLPVASGSLTNTPTPTSTPAGTRTPSATFTATPTRTPVVTNTPTATNTPVIASTATPTATATPTPTATATQANTATPTATATTDPLVTKINSVKGLDLSTTPPTYSTDAAISGQYIVLYGNFLPSQNYLVSYNNSVVNGFIVYESTTQIYIKLNEGQVGNGVFAIWNTNGLSNQISFAVKAR